MAKSADASPLIGKRILVVEDEAMVAMLIESILENHGCRISGHAATIDEALAFLARNRPDAVTLDGNLDGQLSTPVATRLNDLGVPYLVVTGYGERMLADPVLRAAPQLLKPFTPSSLILAAEEHLC